MSELKIANFTMFMPFQNFSSSSNENYKNSDSRNVGFPLDAKAV